MRRALTGIKRFVLWDYPRATWQYDIMVALILGFLFLTPRQWFRDQPRVPHTSRIGKLNGAHGTSVYWVEAAFLAGVPEAQRGARIAELLRQSGGEKREIVRFDPVLDSESNVEGYIVFTRP